MPPKPKTELLLPLFPLPNLVLFPRSLLPLHIFEPRYTRMIADALAGDRRIGIVLLRPGWEGDYHGRPPIHEYGTMGTIEQSEALDEGRYNILLNGQTRFRIIEEIEGRPYRLARVLPVVETPPDAAAAEKQRDELALLARTYLEYLPDQQPVDEIDTAALDSLTHALISSLNLDFEEKQKLLELNDPLARAERVGQELQDRIESLRFLAPYRRNGDPGRN